MDINIITGADAVGMFCRLHMNVKRDIPIRPSEMGVLIFAQKQSTPVTPLMISKFFKIAKPSVTAAVNSLIKKDYLVKTQSDKDGRSYTVSPTSKGIELVVSTFNEYCKAVELLKSNMGCKEFELLIELIIKANIILSGEK